MEIIGDALRQAFMPKHEYESLREEDKAWVKLQRPVVLILLAVICLAICVSTLVSLNIVFPGDSGQRPFCGERRLQPLPMNVKRGDSDLFPGAFYLTDQETADYYWMVVFIPSMIIFFASAIYLMAGCLEEINGHRVLGFGYVLLKYGKNTRLSYFKSFHPHLDDRSFNNGRLI